MYFKTLHTFSIFSQIKELGETFLQGKLFIYKSMVFISDNGLQAGESISVLMSELTSVGQRNSYQIFLLLKSLYWAKLRRDQEAKTLHWESPKKQMFLHLWIAMLWHIYLPVWKQQQIEVGTGSS